MRSDDRDRAGGDALLISTSCSDAKITVVRTLVPDGNRGRNFVVGNRFAVVAQRAERAGPLLSCQAADFLEPPTEHRGRGIVEEQKHALRSHQERRGGDCREQVPSQDQLERLLLVHTRTLVPASRAARALLRIILTGLGLAEVYGIVKRHRGHAEIESMPGVGTTVRLVLPFALGGGTTVAVEQQPRTRAPRRVLLVEDHTDSREFMQALLESDGHTVDTVTCVRDATARLEAMAKNGGTPYQVLVTDIGLPDGSGWDLIAVVRERWPQLRIGVVTGWEPRASAGAEGDFVLRKPVRTSELLAHVAGA